MWKGRLNVKRNKIRKRLRNYFGIDWNKLTKGEKQEYLGKGAYILYKERRERE